MSIRRIQPATNFSEAVVHSGVVYLSGQVALDSPGQGLKDQAREVLGRVDALLTEAGTTRSNMLSAQVLLTDIHQLSEFNTVWEAWLDGPAPARTVAETRLGNPGWAVEVTVLAVVEDPSLHVN